MTVAAFVVSCLALLGSVVAVAYARRSARAAEDQAAAAQRQADAAYEELRIARTPLLVVTLLDDKTAHGPDVLYEVRNDGPGELDSVVVRRPETPDRVIYPLARLGGDAFADEVELGPLAVGTAGRFLLKVGGTPNPPDFRVTLTCTSGVDRWTSSHVLPPRPRPPRIWATPSG